MIIIRFKASTAYIHQKKIHLRRYFEFFLLRFLGTQVHFRRIWTFKSPLLFCAKSILMSSCDASLLCCELYSTQWDQQRATTLFLYVTYVIHSFSDTKIVVQRPALLMNNFKIYIVCRGAPDPRETRFLCVSSNSRSINFFLN